MDYEALLLLLAERRNAVMDRFRKGIQEYSNHDKLLYDVWMMDSESFWVAEALGIEWEVLVDIEDRAEDERSQDLVRNWFEEVWVELGFDIEELR